MLIASVRIILFWVLGFDSRFRIFIGSGSIYGFRAFGTRTCILTGLSIGRIGRIRFRSFVPALEGFGSIFSVDATCQKECRGYE